MIGKWGERQTRDDKAKHLQLSQDTLARLFFGLPANPPPIDSWLHPSRDEYGSSGCFDRSEPVRQSEEGKPRRMEQFVKGPTLDSFRQ
jgi:hypothetical protein